MRWDNSGKNGHYAPIPLVKSVVTARRPFGKARWHS
jgi:hypothetical protein